MSAAEKVIRLPGVVPTRQFVQYPADVFDALMQASLSGNAIKVAMAILRKTHGYRKDFDDLTITHLARAAGISRPAASVAFNALLDRKMITAHKGKYGCVVGFTPVRFWLGMEVAAQEELPADDPSGELDFAGESGDSGAYENRTAVTKPDGRPYENRTHNIKPQYKTPPISPPQSDQPAKADGSGTPSDGGGLSPAVGKTGNHRQRGKVTMTAWLGLCQADGRKPLPGDHPVFADARKLGLPVEWLRLAWQVHRDRYTLDPNYQRKRNADWAAQFHRAVLENWHRLWHLPHAGGQPELTTCGLQRLAVAQQEGGR